MTELGITIRKLRVVLLLILPFTILAALSCDGSPTDSPEHVLGGELSLTAYDGRPIPADLGPLHTRDGRLTDCHSFIAGGYLVLEPDYGVFDLHYERHRCDGHVLSRSSSIGVYWIEEGRFLFRRPAVVESRPDDFIFEGRLRGNAIVVTGYASVPLEFSGPWVEHAPRGEQVGSPQKPIGAAHQMVELDGEFVPHGFSGSGCRFGFLIMEPDYRVFELGVQEEESCTGSQVDPTRWFGVYGQNGDRLIFVVPAVDVDAPDVRFDGRIEGTAIRIDDPEGRSLLFRKTGVMRKW